MTDSTTLTGSASADDESSAGDEAKPSRVAEQMDEAAVAGSERRRPNKRTPLQGWPQLQTLVFLLIAAAIYYLLNVGTGTTPLASTEQWNVWRIVAAIGATLAIGVSIMGVRQFWDLTGSLAFGRRAGAKRFTFLLFALVFVGLILLFLGLATSSMGRVWPIPGMTARLYVVIVIVGLATVPWVALTWAVHYGANTSGPEVGLSRLVTLWTRLTNCIFAFACFVVVALVQTGALRSVWQAQPDLTQAQKDQFTTTDVLMYGGFLAVMMAALAIPLLAAWQGKAKAFVNDKFPFEDFPYEQQANQGWAGARETLEKALHLNVSVLANPLTALSIFTPLIASLLAAFLPELGSG
jgi:hypothetical protein